MLSEQEIIKGCTKQDRAAQKALFQHCYPKLKHVCLRYSKCSEDAEDLVHDTIIRVFEKISSFKGQSSLTSWVCSIAVNAAISNFRKTKHFKLIDLDSANVIEATAAEADTYKNEPDLNQAIEAIRELPKGYQMVLNLYAVENYSHQQIADALNISLGTSKSQLARARKKLVSLIDSKKIK